MRGGSSIFRDHDPMLETLNEDEQNMLTSCAGVIVREDSDGFVAVHYFDTTEELDKEWDRVMTEHEENEEAREDE